eukprot:CAMPEP_0113425220 /NCGR_PEP_ID=MMETSP0013_2-20120614/30032_1 /TAXON_ID=2843 ORGANISM="Skeletonema costatum, Strain 1716" /NCGR_SAMPLE_ID=MMETSP0013_2 /ASSEMBLY_ACC=CAM_ASM_000158 /LENGTH=296 /DNA_ID=CAMNT_0000313325 /DNA_START=1454 /DNA_END=2344 /DNA_ORIENTATION=+ /assembly_acc=CAM_ASM_000158
MGLYSGKPFAVDTEDNRRRHDCFLTGLMRYAIDVLGMPTNLIPFMKVYPIGYSETSHPISLGYHNDTPNLTDELLCRLRMAMCLQTKKRVSWRLYEFKERDNQPVVYQEEDGVYSPTLTLDMEGVSVYAQSMAACGAHAALGIDGDKDDDTFIIPYHRVEDVEGSPALTWVVDYYFPSVEAVMIALEKMRVTPFKLDFSKDDLAKEWLYDEGKLKGISHDLSISKPTATHTSSNKKKKQSKVATKKNPPELKPAAKNKSASKKGGKNKPSKTPPIHPFFSTKNSKSDIDFVDLTED